MIPGNIVQEFIQKISLIKKGQFDDFVSRTRDAFAFCHVRRIK